MVVVVAGEILAQERTRVRHEAVSSEKIIEKMVSVLGALTCRTTTMAVTII